MGLQSLGGTLIVNGPCGDEAAAFANGADICVIGSAGDRAAKAIQAGALVIQGTCGHELGLHAKGGVIYLMAKQNP